MRVPGFGMGARRIPAAPAAARLRHALPQRHRFLRVEAGRRGQHQAHLVGLRFVVARVRQRAAVRRSTAITVCCCCGSMPLIAPAIWPICAELLLRHALRAVAQQRVGDLVAHHHRHRVVVLRHRDQAGVDRHLAARQAERIGLVGLDHVHVPLEGLRDGAAPAWPCSAASVGGRLRGILRDQPLRDLADLPATCGSADQRGLLLAARISLVGLQAQRLLVLGVMALSISTFSPV